MKKILLVAAQLLIVFSVFATNEVVSVYNGNDAPTTDPEHAGRKDPCSGVTFGVSSYTAPSGYNIIQQMDWYANGVLVKSVITPGTTTETLTVIPDAQGNFVVYCKVTYTDGLLHFSTPS